MKKILTAFLLLISAAIANAKEVDFYIGQSNNEWAFNITGRGRTLVGESLIYSKLDYVKVVNNPKHATYKNIDYIEVAYGYRLPDGNWDIKHVGAVKSVDRSIAPGKWMTFQNIPAGMSLDEKKAKDYWIVFIVGTGKNSTVYAHSREDIFN